MAKPTINKASSWSTLMSTAVDDTTMTTVFEAEKFDDATLPPANASSAPTKATKWWSNLVDAFLRAMWERLEGLDAGTYTGDLAVTGTVTGAGVTSTGGAVVSGTASGSYANAPNVRVGETGLVGNENRGVTVLPGRGGGAGRYVIGANGEVQFTGRIDDGAGGDQAWIIVNGLRVVCTESTIRPNTAGLVSAGTQSIPFGGVYNQGAAQVGGTLSFSSSVALDDSNVPGYAVYTGSGGHTLTVPNASSHLRRQVKIVNAGTGLLTIDSADASDVVGSSTAGHVLPPNAWCILVAESADVWRVLDPGQRVRHYYPFLAETASTSRFYLSWHDSTPYTVSDPEKNKYCRRPGRVVSVMLHVDSNTGDVGVRTHNAGTSTTLETVTLNFTGAGTQTATFTSTSSFVSGDILSVSLDSLNAGNLYQGEIEVEYDVAI
jgi:hypothetical protein